MFNIKHKLILFTLILMLMLIQPLTTDVFAVTSFPRQEIWDNPQDWRDEQSNPSSEGDAFTDMVTITYLNDGKNLNATLWLAGTFLTEPPRDLVAYGIFIDVDSNEKTGLYGFDYVTEIFWDGQSWTRILEERTRFQDVRIIEMEENYTGFFDKRKNNVRLSLNLDLMGAPEEYSVAFFTQTKKEIENSTHLISDYSSLVNIPPPEFFISTSPESIVLRQGEEKVIQVKVKSTSGFQPKVDLSIPQKNDITLDLISDELNIPPFGIASTPLEIQVSENAKTGPYMLIVNARATFPLDQLTRTDESDETRFVVQLEEDYSIEKTTSLTIEVVESATLEENVTDFFNRWEVPLTIIVLILTSGGIVFAYKTGHGIIMGRKNKPKTNP